MASTDFAELRRLQQDACTLYSQGKHQEAGTVFLQVADSMHSWVQQAEDKQVRAGRIEVLERCMELARECKAQSQQPDSDDRSEDCEWIVRERPSVSFADVAGLETVKEEIFLKMVYRKWSRKPHGSSVGMNRPIPKTLCLPNPQTH
jgi:hypothetical protein